MKKLTLSLILILAFLSACTGQPVPTSQPPQPTQAAPTSLPPTAAVPTAPAEPTPVPTEAAPTAVPTTVTETGQPVTILSTHMTSVNDGWGIGVIADGTLQRILRTADGGQTWKDVTPPDQAAKKGNADTAAIAAYYGENDAWAIYFSPMPAAASEAMYVWHTADRGQTWQAGDPLLTENLTKEFFIPGELGFSDSKNGWLLAHLGAGMNHDYVALYKTTDAGMTWTLVVDPMSSSDTALPMVCSKSGMTFRDELTGWASGSCNGVMDETFLYGTTDGGINWNLVKLPNPPGQPNLMATPDNICGTLPPVFIDSQNGALAVDCHQAGDQSTRWIYTTSDGGSTWQPSQSGPVNWTTADFTRSGDKWVLQSVQNAGANPTLFAPLFNQPSAPPLLELAAGQSGLDFADALHGWAVASLETDKVSLLTSSDGGQTWQVIQPRLVP